MGCESLAAIVTLASPSMSPLLSLLVRYVPARRLFQHSHVRLAGLIHNTFDMVQHQKLEDTIEGDDVYEREASMLTLSYVDTMDIIIELVEEDEIQAFKVIRRI